MSVMSVIPILYQIYHFFKWLEEMLKEVKTFLHDRRQTGNEIGYRRQAGRVLRDGNYRN